MRDRATHGQKFVPVFPAIGTKAEALGAMYVLEGSTLGGKIIFENAEESGRINGRTSFSGPIWQGRKCLVANLLARP
jgi:heme oxygenase